MPIPISNRCHTAVLKEHSKAAQKSATFSSSICQDSSLAFFLRPVFLRQWTKCNKVSLCSSLISSWSLTGTGDLSPEFFQFFSFLRQKSETIEPDTLLFHPPIILWTVTSQTDPKPVPWKIPLHVTKFQTIGQWICPHPRWLSEAHVTRFHTESRGDTTNMESHRRRSVCETALSMYKCRHTFRVS